MIEREREIKTEREIEKKRIEIETKRIERGTEREREIKIET